MPRDRSFVRSLLANLATLAVLLAPASQLAHAHVMVRDAMDDCGQASVHHHAQATHPASGSPHSHAATCCDFCPPGCHTVVGPAAAVVGVATFEFDAVQPPTAGRAVSAARVPHLLPFSVPPPVPSA